MKRRFQPAFTLIELMIVITIISILASISIIGSTSIQRSTRDDARQSQSTVVAEALEKYYENNNEYPSVASITNQPINDVKQKLAIKDSEVLTFPTVTAGTSALVASNPTPARLTYVANTVDSNANAQCQTSINGYCDAFALQYVKEVDNNTVTINSRHNAVYAVIDPNGPVVLSPPTQPAVVGSQVNSSLVRFTASSASCSIGSVEYKIRYNTSSSSTSSMPDWSTVAWGAATTRDVNPGSSTIFYSQSLARCVSGTESSADSSPSAVDTLNFTPAGTAPSAPTVSASGISTSQISVSWSVSSGSTPITYTVRYGTVSGSYGTTASGCSGISTTSCTIGGLAANTNYYIQVTATNSVSSAAGTSSAFTQSVATPSCSTAPSAPAASASAGSSSSIGVSWSASSTPANCSAPTYTVGYGTSAGSYGSTACSGIAATSCTISGLAASTYYYIQVTATNSYGSAVGTTGVATQAAPPPTCGAVPSGPAPSAGATSSSAIQVSWSASSTPANCSAPTYTVRYGTASGSYGSTACSGIATTTCTITGLTSYVTYYVQVTPANSFGSGTPGTTSASTLPVLTITNTGITNYGVLRTHFSYNGNYGLTSGSPACDSIQVSEFNSANRVCVTQLSSCTANRSVTITGESSVSASTTATGVSVPSSSPSGLSFPNSYANGFQATWNTLPNATYYMMEVWQAGSWVRSVEGTQPPQTMSSLPKGTYNFRVAGANCAGRGTQATGNASTLP